ncbi:MAG: hypothetical protein ACFFED_15440 [Candidatus Thorarchaeota archaeon]
MPDSSEGIIVFATLDILRKAVGRVLFDFNETCEKVTGTVCEEVTHVDVGDTIVFKENMDVMPAEIIAAKIGNDQWYVMSTTELPKSGYPTTQDAMRVAAAESKKLNIIKDFLRKEAGNYVVKEVQEWKPDKLADADRIIKIIGEAAKRYGH